MKNCHPRSPVSAPVAGVVIATLLLSACEEGQFGPTTGPGGGSASVNVVEQEVEKPAVFQATARGLWDGRPSLGGLWVAHVDADQPERAIIINTATGAEVKGALFRKELGNPGPPFQISSGAAAALGILAGVPTEIRVTAVRRETIEVVSNEPAPAIEPAAEGANPEGSTLDPIAASEILAVPNVPAPPEPRPAVAAETPAEKPSDIIETPIVAEEPVADAPTEIVETPVAAAVFAEGTAIPTKPYVQVATLSTVQNADKLVARLEKAGLSALRKPSGSGETLKYIVIVGPASTETKARDNLSKVRGMGFKDAFPSRGL